MSETRSIRPFVLGGAAAAFVIAAAVMVFGGGGAKANAFATLDVIDQAVSVRATPSGAFRTAKAGDALKQGATIKTAGRGLASITYFDGSLTRIGPDAQYHLVALARPNGGKVIVGKLDIGETFHDVKKLSGSKSRFEVQTSHAVAAVRGTRFVARCVPPLPCGIAVIKGVVAVTDAEGHVVLVRAGQRVTIDGTGHLSDLLLISKDDAWINKNLDLSDTSTTIAGRSGTAATNSSPTSNSGGAGSTLAPCPAPTTVPGASCTPAAGVPDSSPTSRSITTFAPATNTTRRTTNTTRPTTNSTTATTGAPSTTRPTTNSTAPTTAAPTTAAPTTTTTARPTTTTARQTTTQPPDPSTSSGPEPSVSLAGPQQPASSPAAPAVPMLWGLAFVGGVAWVGRRDGWS